MFILDTVRPEDAEGKVKEAYSVFPEGMPVPDPLILMSASPDLAYAQSQVIRYFMTHDRLDIGLLAIIRYLVASLYDYEFCINLNSGLLQMAGGFSEEELRALRENPENAPLEEEQKALLLFVLKVVKNPREVTEEDVQKLRDLGWTDRDIFDAAMHGVGMVGPSMLYKAFKK